MYDNDLKILTNLEQEHYVKYLGVLIDSHPSWRYHIDYTPSKISKAVGIIARLSNFLPYNSRKALSFLNRTVYFGLSAWGLAANSNLYKITILQKRALRLM